MKGLPEHLQARFELLRPLGVGAQGRVLLARDRHLEREVAIKVYLPPHPSQGVPPEAARRRFVDEARLAVRCRHPALVAVLDAGEAGSGEPYIVFEYVPGPTWQAALADAPPTPARWLGWVRELADGLDHLHEQGVVHRDVKPANVILRDRERPVLCDLGLARPVDRDSLVTRTGEMVGTPWTMAPEQWTGGPAVPATDQFGLAASAMRTLTGRAPWEGSTFLETYEQVLARRPLELPEDVPAPVAAVLRRGLAWRPRERFPSCAAFAAALSQALAPPPPRPRRPRVTGGARAPRALLVVAALGVAALPWRRGAPPPPTPATAAPTGAARAAADAALERARDLVEPLAPDTAPGPLSSEDGGEAWVARWLQGAGAGVLDPRFPMGYARLLEALVGWTAQVAPGRPGGRRQFLDVEARERFDHLASRVIVPLLYGLARATRTSLAQLLGGGPPGERARLLARRQELLEATRAALVALRQPAGAPPLGVVNLEAAVARADEDRPVEDTLMRVHAAWLEGLAPGPWGLDPQAHGTLGRLRHGLLEGARLPTSLSCASRVRVFDELRRGLRVAQPLEPGQAGATRGEAVAEAVLLASRCPDQVATAAAALHEFRVALPEDPTRFREPLRAWVRQAHQKSLHGLPLGAPELASVARELERFEAAAGLR